MAFYINGNTEDKLSLQEMIEMDIRHGFRDHALDATFEPPLSPSHGLFINQNDFFVNDFDLDTLSAYRSYADAHSLDGITTKRDMATSLQNNSDDKNFDPNLLVNPQTISPVNNDNILSPLLSPHGDDDDEEEDEHEYLEADLIAENEDEIDFMDKVKSTLAPCTNAQITLCQTTHNSGRSSTHIRVPGVQNTMVKKRSSNTVLQEQLDNTFPKPVYSYSCLIAMALKNSDTGALPVSEIYAFMTEHFPYFRTAPDGWKNSVRHNLSLNKCFEKIENSRSGGNTRKGCLWGLNPDKIEKMEEEIVKWRKKDPVAVKKSMSHPDKLEVLERGNIGSHCPMPTEVLNALRQAQLQRLNSAGSPDGNGVQVTMVEVLPANRVQQISSTPAVQHPATTPVVIHLKDGTVTTVEQQSLLDFQETEQATATLAVLQPQSVTVTAGGHSVVNHQGVGSNSSTNYANLTLVDGCFLLSGHPVAAFL